MKKETRSRIIKYSLAIILSALMLFFLFRLINISYLTKILSSIRPLWIIPAALVYFFSYIVRTARFRILLGIRSISFPRLLSIVLQHAFFLKIVPFKGGELSFLFLLRKQGNIKYGYSTSVLAVARLIDFIAMVAFFVLTLPFARLISPIPTAARIAIIAFGVACILAVLILPRLLTLFARILYTICFKGRQHKLRRKLLHFALSARHGSREIGLLRLLPAFLFSFTTWAVLFFAFWLLFFSLGSEYSLIRVFFISSMGILTSTLPLSLGTFGTFESGWVAAALLTGMEKEYAIVSGFYQNMMAFLFCGFFAMGAGIIRTLVDRNGINRQQ